MNLWPRVPRGTSWPSVRPARAVDDYFVVAAHDLATGDELAGFAGAAWLEADEEEAVRCAVQLSLNRLVGDGTGTLNAVYAADQFPGIARNARGFGERAFGVGLDDPEVGIRGAGLP